MSPTELARGEGVRLQSLTRLLAELQAEGWLRRRDDPADGRRSLLALTPKGSAGLRAAVEAAEQAMAANWPTGRPPTWTCCSVPAACSTNWNRRSGAAEASVPSSE
jgi:hypothetical protein